MDPRESALRHAFLAAVNECRKIGYNPTRFVQMLNERGAVNTARSLLNTTKVSEGFTELYLRRKRLDLSVEAIVLRSEHRDSFTASELGTARQRLRDVGYSPPWDKADDGVTDPEPDPAVSVKRITPSDTTQTILPPFVMPTA